MRAWLLLLAVLATFLTIVQVASTEDISARFITAIKPIKGHTHKAVTRRKNTATTTAILKTTTALTKVFNPNFDLAATSSSSTALSTSSSSSSSSKLVYKSSDKSDKQNEHASAEIIEIKSINRLENEVNKVQSIVAHTDQLESSHSKSKQKHKKMKNEYRVAISDESAKTSDEQQQQQQQSQTQKQHHHTRHHKQRKESKTATTRTTSESPVIQLESHALAATTSGSHEDAFSSSSASSSSATDEIIASVEVPANADAVIEEDGPATYSNQEIIKDKVKVDPSVLAAVETSLLSIFNMKRPPKIDRSKIIIPEAMRELYKQMTGKEDDLVNIPSPDPLTKNHANTMRGFTHKDSKIDDQFPHHHRFRLHFDVKSIPSEEKLKAAELQLTRDTIGHAALHPRQAQRTRYQVLVYDIERVGVRGKRRPNYQLLDSKTVRLNTNETVNLNVQPAVDRWLATPQRNYGLLVEVQTIRSLKPAPHHHVRLRRSADEPHEQWQHKQPLLYTYTDDGRSRSKRGHRRPHRRKNNQEICRRDSLYIDFVDVGWSNWIVAPPGYEAGQCRGRCPFPLADHLNSTNHAVVQTLVHNLNPAKVPEACCVPTRLEGISMLYLNDQNTVVLKNYQDMTVVDCGCR